MSTQLDIDFESRARRSDPETSHEAARRAGEFAGHHHARILAALAQDARTIYELAHSTGIDHVAVARRMKELEDAGLVVRTSLRRNSPSGRPCVVWSLPPT